MTGIPTDDEKEHITKLFGHFILSLQGLGVRPEAVLYGSVLNAEIMKNHTTDRDLEEWNQIIKLAQEDFTKRPVVK